MLRHYIPFILLSAQNTDPVQYHNITYHRMEKVPTPPPSIFIKVIKILNFLIGGLIIAFGIVGLAFMIINDVISSQFFLVFSPLFIISFGVVMIAVQLKNERVLSKFEFLKTLLGKGIFYIYISTSVFFFFTCGYDQAVLAWICAMVIFGMGIIYVMLHFWCENDFGDEFRHRLE